VKIQKEFKVTPHYLEKEPHSLDAGYYMGVYLCLGQPIHMAKMEEAIPISNFSNYGEIHQYMCQYRHLLVFLGEGRHKIKKKAEQIACESAIRILDGF
jgi:hypothetical protein